MVFPLQCLPLLAQYDVVKSMKLEEMYLLSTCSKKIRNVVKQSLHHQQFTVVVDNGSVTTIRNRNSSDNISLSLCWDIGKGSKRNVSKFETIEFMSYVFNKPSVQLTLWEKNENCQEDFQKVEKHGLSLRKIIAVFNNYVKFSLENCRHAKKLELFLEDSRVLESANPLCVDKLTISSFAKQNMDYVINVAMNCNQLKAFACDFFNNKDINKFLQAWKTSNSRLKYVQMTYEGGVRNLVGIQDAVPVQKVWIAKNAEKVKNYTSDTFPDGNCFLIRQQNGNEGIVYDEHRAFVLDTDFRIVR